MSDLIGAARILAENAGSVPVFLDPPRPDGGSRARLAVYLACWAWAVEEAELRRVCVVLSIEPGT